VARLNLDELEQRINNIGTLEESFHFADSAHYDIQTSNFILGGVLLKARLHGWFGSYNTFDEMVQNRFSMSPSKAQALISIYKWMMNERLKWDDVAHLGWVKLSMLVGTMTASNWKEWRKTAEDNKVEDLRAIIHGEDPISIQRKTFHLKLKDLKYVNKRLYTFMKDNPGMTEPEALIAIFREEFKKEASV
jgi:hypothetical protein